MRYWYLDENDMKIRMILLLVDVKYFKDYFKPVLQECYNKEI